MTMTIAPMIQTMLYMMFSLSRALKRELRARMKTTTHGSLLFAFLTGLSVRQRAYGPIVPVGRTGRNLGG